MKSKMTRATARVGHDNWHGDLVMQAGLERPHAEEWVERVGVNEQEDPVDGHGINSALTRLIRASALPRVLATAPFISSRSNSLVASPSIHSCHRPIPSMISQSRSANETCLTDRPQLRSEAIHPGRRRRSSAVCSGGGQDRRTAPCWSPSWLVHAQWHFRAVQDHS